MYCVDLSGSDGMKKRALFGIGLGLGIGLLTLWFAVHQKSGTPALPAKATLLPTHRYGQTYNSPAPQQSLADFIAKRLTGPYGVYTNLLDTDQSQEAATGHEVLSESASLMLRYRALAGQPEAFKADWAVARRTFDLNSVFSYRFSPKRDKTYPLNAAVDDLRLIRALYEAGEAFGDAGYTAQADEYGRRFYHSNVKHGNLYDFYDESYKQTNRFITLCYIDLPTLERLAIPSGERQDLVRHMRNIAENGYLFDMFPFYETRYNYTTNAYESDNIHTVESLLTILSLAEVHREKEASLRYIKEHVRAGTLYGEYTREGTPVNDIQSTAIYAITAMIGSVTGDAALYRDSMERMNAFQIKSGDSPLYGGFGDAGTGNAYSFDNLMALLAYSY